VEFICFFLIVVLVGWLLIQILTTDSQKPEGGMQPEEIVLNTPTPEKTLDRNEAPASVDGMRSKHKCPSCGASLGLKPSCDYCGDAQ
jgi:hypothetical protein